MVVAVLQPGAGRGFAALEVRGALGLDHRFRHAELDRAVEPPDAAGDPAVVVGHGDLVAEELRRLGAGVRDQGLFLVQFQLEVIAQELGQAGPDLLGLGFGSGEPEQRVIGVTCVPQPPVAGIAGIRAGQAAQLLAQLPHCGTVAVCAGTSYR